MSRPIPAAYRGAIDSPCPTCSAEPGEFCVVEVDRRGPRQAPAYPTRSFSEPIYPHETQE